MGQLMIDDRYKTMPWDELDNVVFDVGNVLLSFQPGEVLEELFPDDPELRATLMVRVFHSPYWVMLDRGTITIPEAIEGMAGHNKALIPAIKQIMATWVDLKVTIPDGIEALEAAKAHGKKLYVLSNYHDDSFEHVYRKYAFFQWFDGLVISAKLHLLKPDPAIYRHLIATYGLDPARTLFIDDAQANIEAALNEGWQGFCLNRPGKLHDFLNA